MDLTCMSMFPFGNLNTLKIDIIQGDSYSALLSVKDGDEIIDPSLINKIYFTSKNAEINKEFVYQEDCEKWAFYLTPDETYSINKGLYSFDITILFVNPCTQTKVYKGDLTIKEKLNDPLHFDKNLINYTKEEIDLLIATREPRFKKGNKNNLNIIVNETMAYNYVIYSAYRSLTTVCDYVGHYVDYNNNKVLVNNANKHNLGIIPGETIAYDFVEVGTFESIDEYVGYYVIYNEENTLVTEDHYLSSSFVDDTQDENKKFVTQEEKSTISQNKIKINLIEVDIENIKESTATQIEVTQQDSGALISLKNADGNVISSAPISFSTEDKHLISATLDLLNERIVLLLSDQTSVNCDISSLFDLIENVNNKLDEQVIVKRNENKFSYDGDTVSFKEHYKNLDLGSESTYTENIALADSTKAGMMSPSDYQQIQENTSRIEALEGVPFRLRYTAKSDPTAQEINQFVIDSGYTPSSSISVLVADTKHLWRYYGSGSSAQWVDDGVDTVTQFTNSNPGIIKGSQNDGQIFAESNGTGSVNGWSTLKTRVTNVENNLEDKVDKVSGKGLSTNDYTTADKTKLAGIENGAEVNILEGVKDSSGNDLSITNKKVQLSKNAVGLSNVDNTSDMDKPVSTAVGQVLDVLEGDINSKVSFQEWGSVNDEFQKRIDNSALELEILKQKVKGYGLEVGDETFKNLSKEQLPSSITVDNNQYPIIDDVRTLVGEIDGETRNVNQLIQNGNFESTENWSASRFNLSTQNNELICETRVVYANNGVRQTKATPIIEGHKYLVVGEYYFIDFIGSIKFGFSTATGSGQLAISVPSDSLSSNTWIKAYGIRTATSGDATATEFMWSSNTTEVGQTIKMRNLQYFDLTAMFSAEMASTFTDSTYLTDESADIIKFRKLLPKTYYDFTTGTNYSPTISKVKFYNADNLSVGEISLPQKYTLSGTQKLVITKNATEADPSNPYYSLTKYDGDTPSVISSTLTLNEVSAIRKNGGYIEVVGNDNIDYAQPTVKLKTAYKKANA